MFYIIFVLFWYSKLAFCVLWTMILEDKENMWTSNLLKKSNNDNSAVVVAFASNNNIKQYQTQFKYKISVLHSLLWVSNTQRFIHYKEFWKLKSSISERISVCLKEVLFIAPSMLFLWKKKKQTNVINARPFIKGLRYLLLKVRIRMGISSFIIWYCIHILVHLFCFHFRVQER